MNDLYKWYCSSLTGEIVKTPFGVIRTAISDRIHYKIWNLKWKVVWLAA